MRFSIKLASHNGGVSFFLVVFGIKMGIYVWPFSFCPSGNDLLFTMGLNETYNKTCNMGFTTSSQGKENRTKKDQL